ncbi:MAG: DUF1667 domain-containing protein [Bacilli bacterium]
MRDLICIVCPRGCHLTVENGKVTGNFCKRGIQYGLQEATNPVRMVTSTVAIHDGLIARLPVVTSQSIPKSMMFEVIREIQTIEVVAPITIGTIIIENVLNTGTNIIATRTVERRSS